jgi:L-ascorbate metabolism protein UlaG (beta-lactamase superfamily)
MYVTLLSNAGILIDASGCRLLADGLYSDTGHSFSPMPPDIEGQLMAVGKPGWINYLLFTHLHPDHFDAERTNRFISANNPERIFLPLGGGTHEANGLSVLNAGAGSVIQTLDLKKGESVSFDLGGILTLTAFCTGHIGKQYADVSNICYLLKAGDKKLLITGDADVIHEDFSAAFMAKPIDAILVNPLFFQATQGAALVKELGVRQVILYHIPSEREDIMNLRTMVRNQVRRYKDEEFAVYPMLSPMQSISV